MKKYMLLFLIAHGAMYSMNEYESGEESWNRYMQGSVFPAHKAIMINDMRLLDMYRDPATLNEERFGETPLQSAIDSRNPRAVAILLKNGARTTFKGGRTALSYAQTIREDAIKNGRRAPDAALDQIIEELKNTAAQD